MEEGKLFVVIAVLSTILVGIGIYLFILDRKVTALYKRMEKENFGKPKN
jgi:hypothetical protein